ncbi:MAG: uroporphyrinogen decarboxylase [Alphaproteobacteria bacterium]|nr:uroporphyrinogen decarboxylase [Alphaproteobacteria bacterium]
MKKKILNLFTNNAISSSYYEAPPPIWLMRQAGRYLPEYRELRTKAGGFLDLCQTPTLAEEITLQPIRRYGFDAAIVFSDILLIPQALGQDLWFAEGEGPRLTPIKSAISLNPNDMLSRLAPTLETLERLHKSLPETTTLIGFCGAPWTVATYMIAGQGLKDHAPIAHFARTHKQSFQEIIDLLVAVSIDYLEAQIKSGADMLQIFDSWAGALTGTEFEHWCIEPMAQIIAGLRARHITTPIIAFPRAMAHPPHDYITRTKCDALSLDTHANRQAIIAATDPSHILQGNLDPAILVAGGKALDEAIDNILLDFSGRKFIFNLGHGILQQTPPDHVSHLVARVRELA